MTDTGGNRRYVFLDPDGTGSDQGWACIVVAAETGVVYQVQGGGFGCVQYAQEGCLIPLFGQGLDEEPKEAFVGELKGRGSRGLDWPEDLLGRLREAVAFHVYGSANRDDPFPAPLVLDETRLAEIDEAWGPVVTPDGPGVLVRENSDQDTPGNRTALAQVGQPRWVGANMRSTAGRTTTDGPGDDRAFARSVSRVSGVVRMPGTPKDSARAT